MKNVILFLKYDVHMAVSNSNISKWSTGELLKWCLKYQQFAIKTIYCCVPQGYNFGPLLF